MMTWMKALLLGSSEAAFELVQVGSGLTGTTGAITLTGAQEGDLALAAIAAVDIMSEATVAVPSDWTDLYAPSLPTVTTVMRVVGKVLGSGDTTLPTSSDRNRAALVILRPNKPIGSFSAEGFGQENGSGNPAAVTVSASGGTAPLVVVGAGWGMDGAVSFTTASPAFDGTATPSNSGGDVILGWKIYNSSPANHTVDVGDTGTWSAIFGGYVVVSE